MNQKIIIKPFKTGRDKAFSRFGLILGTLVVAHLVVGVPSFVRGMLTGAMNNSAKNNLTLIAVAGIVSLGLLVLQYWLQILTGIGLIRIQLNIIDNKTAEFAQLFKSEGKFWKYFGGIILYGLIIIGGLILLIVPGIYWAIKYQFVSQLIVDKNLGPIEALKVSGKITEGYKYWLLGFGIILGLINIATIFTLLLGLIITIPVTVMAHMYVYRELSANVTGAKSASKTRKPAVASVKS
jgi:uncharacterized membrane protein